MATLLRRSYRSSKVPQVASSSTMPLDPPADQAAAKDRQVNGSDSRHQVATLPSTSSVEGGTFRDVERAHSYPCQDYCRRY